ncbi:MAG: polysaccharide pyruvyl transferase CsaB [Prochlorococcaceae cyanobacterium]
MGQNSCRPLLCGYYGEHNLGDDALLAALLQQLPAGCRPLVTAFDQQQLHQRFRVDTVPRRSLVAVLRALGSCDALVLGGGSLLQDSTSFRSLLYYAALITTARLQAKPVLLWGQGLGPLRRRASRALVRALLPLATACSWRDPASAALAQRWGIDGQLGSDPVWALPARSWQGPGGAIVVCWRPTPLLQGQAWRPYLEALAQLADSGEREVLWLPFHQDQDSSLLAELQAADLVPAALLARSRQLQAADPEAAQAIFQGAGLVIAMRLHALILAALAGAPLAALSYDPKVRAAAEAIGCPCRDLGCDGKALAKQLLGSWRSCLDQPPAASRLQALQQTSAVHHALLQQLTCSNSGSASG